MKKLWADFKAFIMRGNVVDMAVGVAVAGAFTAIVTAFTKGFISPLIALLSKNSDLTEMKWILRPEVSHLDEAGETVVDTAEVAFLWGSFVQAIIDFLIIAAAMFIVLRVVSGISNRAKKVLNDVHNTLNEDKIAAEKAKAEAEAQKKAAEEAAAKAAADKEAAEAAALEAKKLNDEKARLTEEMDLLREIRDLLKKEA